MQQKTNEQMIERQNSYLAQPGCNIPRRFAGFFLSVAMFETSREHLGDILMEKVF